jgi:hypothetical protein
VRTRLFATTAGAAVLAMAVWFGWADAARSLDLLTGRVVTATTEFAFVRMVCWLGVAVIAGAVIGGVVGGTSGARRSLRRGTFALLVGAALLGLGIVHHSSAFGVCCANATTAQQAEQRVR